VEVKQRKGSYICAMNESSALLGSEQASSRSETASNLPTASLEEVSANNVRQELPFLVTSWLAQFASNSNKRSVRGTAAASETDDETEALARIRHAASELAAAFSSLGAFGTAARVRISV
jgi:hypothetical protein